MDGFSIYDHFFTGKSLRDQETRELLLLLLDLGNSLEMEEAEILLDNLLDFCGFYAKLESNKEKSKEELVGSAEVEWTGRLQEVFHNATKLRKTQDMHVLVKDVLSKFNHKHDYKVN